MAEDGAAGDVYVEDGPTRVELVATLLVVDGFEDCLQSP
jgi:hypothetical protein